MKKTILIITALLTMLCLFGCAQQAEAPEKPIASADTDKLINDIEASAFFTDNFSGYTITDITVNEQTDESTKATVVANDADKTLKAEIKVKAVYEDGSFIKCEFDPAAGEDAYIYYPLTGTDFDDTGLVEIFKERFGLKDTVTVNLGELEYNKTAGTMHIEVFAYEQHKYCNDYHKIYIDRQFDGKQGTWSEDTYTYAGVENEWNIEAYFAKQEGDTNYIAVSNDFLYEEMPTGYINAEVITVAETSPESFFGEIAENEEVRAALSDGYSLKFKGTDYNEFLYCMAATESSYKGEAFFIGKNNLAVFDKECYTIDDEAKTVTIELKELIFVSYILQ